VIVDGHEESRSEFHGRRWREAHPNRVVGSDSHKVSLLATLQLLDENALHITLSIILLLTSSLDFFSLCFM